MGMQDMLTKDAPGDKVSAIPVSLTHTQLPPRAVRATIRATKRALYLMLGSEHGLFDLMMAMGLGASRSRRVDSTVLSSTELRGR